MTSGVEDLKQTVLRNMLNVSARRSTEGAVKVFEHSCSIFWRRETPTILLQMYQNSHHKKLF